MEEDPHRAWRRVLENGGRITEPDQRALLMQQVLVGLQSGRNKKVAKHLDRICTIPTPYWGRSPKQMIKYVWPVLLNRPKGLPDQEFKRWIARFGKTVRTTRERASRVLRNAVVHADSPVKMMKWIEATWPSALRCVAAWYRKAGCKQFLSEETDCVIDLLQAPPLTQEEMRELEDERAPDIWPIPEHQPRPQ